MLVTLLDHWRHFYTWKNHPFFSLWNYFFFLSSLSRTFNTLLHHYHIYSWIVTFSFFLGFLLSTTSTDWSPDEGHRTSRAVFSFCFELISITPDGERIETIPSDSNSIDLRLITTHPAINLSFTLTNHWKTSPDHSGFTISHSTWSSCTSDMLNNILTFFCVCFLAWIFFSLHSIVSLGSIKHTTQTSCSHSLHEHVSFSIYPCGVLSTEASINQYSQTVNPRSPSSPKSLLLLFFY